MCLRSHGLFSLRTAASWHEWGRGAEGHSGSTIEVCTPDFYSDVFRLPRQCSKAGGLVHDFSCYSQVSVSVTLGYKNKVPRKLSFILSDRRKLTWQP